MDGGEPPSYPADAAVGAASAELRPALRWRAPEELSPPIPVDARPAFDADDRGVAAAAWLEVARTDTGFSIALRAAVRGRAGAFGPSEEIAVPTLEDFSVIPTPQVAVDGRGNVLATWLTARRAGSAIEVTGHLARRSARTATWGPAETIFVTETYVPRSTPFENHALPIEVTPAGDAIVVWEESVEAQRSIRTAVISRFGPVSPIETVATGPGGASPFEARNPRIALSDRGAALAVWKDGVGVHAALRPRGRRWQSPATLAEGSFGLGDAQGGFDGEGGAIVVWTERASLHSRVRRAGARAWDAEQSFPTGSLFPLSMQLAVAETGDAAVAWSGFDFPPADGDEPFGGALVRSATRAARSGAWSPPATVSPMHPEGRPEIIHSADQPAIAYSRDGALRIAWRYFEWREDRTGDAAAGIEAISRRRSGAVFGPVETVSRAVLEPVNGDLQGAPGSPYFPRLDTGGRHGEAIALWLVAAPGQEGLPPLYTITAASQCAALRGGCR